MILVCTKNGMIIQVIDSETGQSLPFEVNENADYLEE